MPQPSLAAAAQRQDETAATSPAVPTSDAGNCPGGPENRSSNGSLITTCPGIAEATPYRIFAHECQRTDEGCNLGSINLVLCHGVIPPSFGLKTRWQAISPRRRSAPRCLSQPRASNSELSMADTASVASRFASALPKPSRTNARAITARQPANASRPAAVSATDCGADFSNAVDILNDP